VLAYGFADTTYASFTWHWARKELLIGLNMVLRWASWDHAYYYYTCDMITQRLINLYSMFECERQSIVFHWSYRTVSWLSWSTFDSVPHQAGRHTRSKTRQCTLWENDGRIMWSTSTIHLTLCRRRRHPVNCKWTANCCWHRVYRTLFGQDIQASPLTSVRPDRLPPPSPVHRRY